MEEEGVTFGKTKRVTVTGLNLTLSAEDLHVEVCQAACSRERQLDHALDGDGVAVQVVKQRAVLVIVRHQPQLRPCAVV